MDKDGAKVEVLKEGNAGVGNKMGVLDLADAGDLLLVIDAGSFAGKLIVGEFSFA